MKALYIYIFIIATCFVILSLDHMQKKLDYAQKAMLEREYFKGQRDFAEGDIRIKRVNSHWAWEYSTWEDYGMPLYDPEENVVTHK